MNKFNTLLLITSVVGVCVPNFMCSMSKTTSNRINTLIKHINVDLQQNQILSNKISGEDNGVYYVDYKKKDRENARLYNLKITDLTSLTNLIHILELVSTNSKVAVPCMLNLITDTTLTFLADSFAGRINLIMLITTNPSITVPHIINLIDETTICSENFTQYIIPILLKVDQTATTAHLLKLINAKTICNETLGRHVMLEILKACPKAIESILASINENTITDPNVIQFIIPKVLVFFPDSNVTFAQHITKNNFQKLPLTLYRLITKNGQDTTVIDMLRTNLSETINNMLTIKNDLLDIYLFDTKKGEAYAKKENIKYLLEDNKGKKIHPNTHQTISNTMFTLHQDNIIEIFNEKWASDIPKRISIIAIKKQEEAILKRGNYPIAHGRNSRQFVTDTIFMHLQDIFFGKETDKSCHYAQHYAFPGETWAKMDIPLYQFWKHIFKDQWAKFIHLPINLPEELVEDIVQNGITSQEDYSYLRSCLQFGSDVLGTKGGSSALAYVLRNSNVDITRGATAIAQLFKKLGKALNKNVMPYYKKYKSAFELICKAAEKFEHGTMLVYEFTPQALQKYVKVTHSSGGHIDNEDSGISIKGVRTTDPKFVLDMLMKSPEDFDEPHRQHEYFWPLTDEGTANPFNDDVKTYAFHIGKHDEVLAQSIKQWIAKLFERIKIDMAKDGIIEYALNKSKL